MARPSKYGSDILDKAKGYLEELPEGEAIPSIAGLALFLNIHRDTVYDWAADKNKAEFSDIVGSILAKQESTLMNKGLFGEFNPTITKLLLTKHGYSEKSELNVGGQPNNPIKGKWEIEIIAQDNDSSET